MLDSAKDRIMGYYEGKYGPAKRDGWKRSSDKLFGPNEAIAVYQLLTQKGFIPDLSQSFTFLSPTSSYPSHELVTWEHDSNLRTGSNLFLAGDMREINLGTQKPILISTSDEYSHRFNFFRWDAENLPFANGSVDIIWDRKGWLWHLSEHIGNADRLLRTLESYRRLLKAGGCIVTDNIMGFDTYIQNLPYGQALEFLVAETLHEAGLVGGFELSTLMPYAPGQYEESTVNKINELNAGIWSRISDQFSIEDVGLSILRNRVLVKK